MLDDAECVRDLDEYDESIVAGNEVCAEGDGAGTCYGDSGGPLVVTGRDGDPKLAGVVSWGAECATSPGVFAEMPAFAEWIEQGVAAGLSGEEHPDGEGTVTDDDTLGDELGDTDRDELGDTDGDELGDTDRDDADGDELDGCGDGHLDDA